jgi:hypothetical protein
MYHDLLKIFTPRSFEEHVHVENVTTIKTILESVDVPINIVTSNQTGCHFLGSGFFGFWVLGIILNFPEPPFLAREFPRTLARISQNPKKASVSAQAQSTTRLRRVVSFTHTACLRKRRAQHDYGVLCRSRYTDRVTSKTRLRRCR